MDAKKTVLFILLVHIVLGCNQPYDSTDPADLAFLDIVDAQYLFIGSGSVSKSMKAVSDRLFKITDNGYVEEVSQIDDDGNEITELLNPVAVYNGNDSYVLVCFGTNLYYVDSGYLVRKSDGAVFSLGDEGFPRPNYQKAHHIFTDKYGNMYYKGGLKEIRADLSVLLKIDTSNPEDLTREVYSAPTDIVSGFVVDSEGNAIYSGNRPDDWSYITRLRKLNGGIYNLPFADYWIGLDGNAYFYSYQNPIIQKITVDESFNVTISDYGEIAQWGGIGFKLSLLDRIILVSNSRVNGQYQCMLIEVYNPTATPRVISTWTGFQTLRAAIASTSFYYIAGNNESQQAVIIRVDPTDDSHTYLLNSGEYEIHEVSVSDSDELTFSGLRFTDGKKIIGEIDVDGTLTVIDEELDVTVVSLERIR